MKNKIDISTEEKRKEIYDIFDSLTSKNKKDWVKSEHQKPDPHLRVYRS